MSVRSPTNCAQRLEVLLRAVNRRHGTHGFTSLPSEGLLRIFTLWNNPSTPAGFEPANSDPVASMITTGPPGSTKNYGDVDTMVQIFTVTSVYNQVTRLTLGCLYRRESPGRPTRFIGGWKSPRVNICTNKNLQISAVRENSDRPARSQASCRLSHQAHRITN